MTPSLKNLVAQRARFCCEYCLCPSAYCPDPFSIEHIRARAHGGGDDPDNLALSCQGCNGHKADATEATDPITGEIVPLFHPRKHVWSEHFGWENDSAIVRGKSAIGRATVLRLMLNREPVVNLRRLLRLAGIQPPS